MIENCLSMLSSTGFSRLAHDEAFESLSDHATTGHYDNSLWSSSLPPELVYRRKSTSGIDLAQNRLSQLGPASGAGETRMVPQSARYNASTPPRLKSAGGYSPRGVPGSAPVAGRDRNSGSNLLASKHHVSEWELARFQSRYKKEDFHVYPSARSIKVGQDGTSELASTPGAGGGSVSGSGGVERAPVDGVDGFLTLTLLAGTGLHSSHAALRDIYCVVEIDSVRKARSMIRTSTECFEWDESFELEMVNGRYLSLLLYQWDPRTRHKLCFYGNLSLKSLVANLTQGYKTSEKVALRLEPKGTLYMDIGHVSNSDAFLRRFSTHPRAIFGTPLEVVVRREQSDMRVPLIVQKCVEEVERRGMDVAGIYRLTGSIKMKEHVREAIHAGVREADLSPEKVPDIHAITGELRDRILTYSDFS